MVSSGRLARKHSSKSPTSSFYYFLFIVIFLNRDMQDYKLNNVNIEFDDDGDRVSGFYRILNVVGHDTLREIGQMRVSRSLLACWKLPILIIWCLRPLRTR